MYMFINVYVYVSKQCSQSGDIKHEPALFQIQTENKTISPYLIPFILLFLVSNAI